MKVRGMTSNPAISEKAIAQSHDYDKQICEALAKTPSRHLTGMP